MTTEQATWTVQLPESYIGDLTHRIIKLNKRAKRLGMQPLTTDTTTTPIRTEHKVEHLNDHGGSTRKWELITADQQPQGPVRFWQEITITGQIPALNGWQAIAVLDNVAGQAIVRSIPSPTGERHPTPEHHKDVTRCDHCHTKRNRNNLVVVYSPSTGEYMTLGKTCLKDFCPSLRDPQRQMDMVAMWIDCVRHFSEIDPNDPDHIPRHRVPDAYSTLGALEWAVACVRKDGYRKRPQDYDDRAPMGTADMVRELMVYIPYGSEAHKRQADMRKEYAPTDDDRTKAVTVHEFAQHLSGDSDYASNVRILSAQPFIEWKHVGFVVSAVSAYNRELTKAEEKKTHIKSTFLGHVKARQEATVKLLKTHSWDTEWGTTTLHVFVTPEGQQVKWFASNCGPQGDIGETYKVKLTPKKHELDSYTNEPVTIVNRVAFL